MGNNHQWQKALMLAEAEINARRQAEIEKLAREKYYQEEPNRTRCKCGWGSEGVHNECQRCHATDVISYVWRDECER